MTREQLKEIVAALDRFLQWEAGEDCPDPDHAAVELAEKMPAFRTELRAWEVDSHSDGNEAIKALDGAIALMNGPPVWAVANQLCDGAQESGWLIFDRAAVEALPADWQPDIPRVTTETIRHTCGHEGTVLKGPDDESDLELGECWECEIAGQRTEQEKAQRRQQFDQLKAEFEQ